MRVAHVRLQDRSYSIVIGRDIFRKLPKFLKKSSIQTQNFIIVTQKPIAALYREKISRSFLEAGASIAYFVTPSEKHSENDKSAKVYSQLLKKISELDGHHRSVAVVALGGGVVGDLAGFAASVYRRGVPLVQIPTTLTAQVDSAIGGKNGIDLPQGKNLLGTIYQPRLVLCDVEFLDSLPDRVLSDGFAEIIKYGVIRDKHLFEMLGEKGLSAARSDKGWLEEVIFRCARIKAEIVQKDERDTKGLRMILNFGHTAGHAIEAAAGYSGRYTHGEAVGIGMLVACEIGKLLKTLKDVSLPEKLESVLVKYNLPIFYKGLATETLLKAMGYDKKSTGGANCFVLPVTLGKTTLVRGIPENVITQALLSRKG